MCEARSRRMEKLATTNSRPLHRHTRDNVGLKKVVKPWRSMTSIDTDIVSWPSHRSLTRLRGGNQYWFQNFYQHKKSKPHLPTHRKHDSPSMHDLLLLAHRHRKSPRMQTEPLILIHLYKRQNPNNHNLAALDLPHVSQLAPQRSPDISPILPNPN